MEVICIGDSLTFGFKMSRKNSWPQIVGKDLEIKVKNKGVCGDTTAGMLSRFGRDVVDEKPSYVMIMGGSNDLMFQLPESTIYSNLATMVYQAYHYRIQPIIGVPMPIIPSVAEQNFDPADDMKEVNKKIILLRNWILYFAHKQQMDVVDFFDVFYDPISKKGKKDLYTDGVHPTKEGSRQMAQKAIETISKYIK
ncbi:MAG TPA: GDSL-type esterase/lipase family protein [Oscillospiraceae bacterium]|nr:GDSL-type esterase/lipase family protein [Oscillospiraceae bacterium]